MFTTEVFPLPQAPAGPKTTLESGECVEAISSAARSAYRRRSRVSPEVEVSGSSAQFVVTSALSACGNGPI
ncbi:hypothetical protein [Nocardioides zeae]